MVSKSTPEPVDVAVGAKIRQFRAMRGISQEKLGDACGITFQQIQKYEKGVNRIGSSRLQQIATVLGVKVADFFPDDDAGASPQFSPEALKAALAMEGVPADLRPLALSVLRQFVGG